MPGLQAYPTDESLVAPDGGVWNSSLSLDTRGAVWAPSSPKVFSCARCGVVCTSPMKLRSHQKRGCVGPSGEGAWQCAGCGEAGKKLSRCTRCRCVWYCSKECQVHHWKNHKKSCTQLSRSREFGFSKWVVTHTGLLDVKSSRAAGAQRVSVLHKGELIWGIEQGRFAQHDCILTGASPGGWVRVAPVGPCLKQQHILQTSERWVPIVSGIHQMLQERELYDSVDAEMIIKQAWDEVRMEFKSNEWKYVVGRAVLCLVECEENAARAAGIIRTQLPKDGPRSYTDRPMEEARMKKIQEHLHVDCLKEKGRKQSSNEVFIRAFEYGMADVMQEICQ